MLIVALLIAAIIALVLGGYLSLNLNTARLSQRTFNRGAAFHLAEAGLEEGLWAYNRVLDQSEGPWKEWDIIEGGAWRTLKGFDLTKSTNSSVKIHATPVNPSESDRPTLVALATVTSPGGAPVHQMIEVSLSRRSFFAAGIVARESLVFNGSSSSFDSWDSDPDADPATPSIPYSESTATDVSTVATGSTDPNGIDLTNTRLNGYFCGVGILPRVGTSGLIGPFGTADGMIDSSRISGDFRAGFPVVKAPADGTWLNHFDATLGTEGTATSWSAESLSLNGQDSLTILGDVVLVLTSQLNALSLAGQASIIIPDRSSLTLYTDGDIQISGQGMINDAARPAALQFWSTVATPEKQWQTISLSGRGALSAVIYAPEAAVTINGQGTITGSIVARTLVFNGNTAFHYDESLARLNRHAGFRAERWRTIDDPVEFAARLPVINR